MKRALAIPLLTGLAVSANAATFVDTTFNLSDYDRMSYPNGVGTVESVQIPTGGNPGSALQVTSSATLLNASFTVDNYFFNRSFTYDPLTSGAIAAITWSQDIYVTALSGPSLSAEGAAILVRQNANMYVAVVGVPVRANVYQTVTQTILTPNSLYLITNPALSTIDTTQHPSFTSGVLQFGFDIGATLRASGVTQTISVLERLDNFSVTVTSAVPEPSSALLFAFGAISIAFSIKQRAPKLSPLLPANH